jgi:hypothetical protein
MTPFVGTRDVTSAAEKATGMNLASRVGGVKFFFLNADPYGVCHDHRWLSPL